jgi:hypothetical protein
MDPLSIDRPFSSFATMVLGGQGKGQALSGVDCTSLLRVASAKNIEMESCMKVDAVDSLLDALGCC